MSKVKKPLPGSYKARQHLREYVEDEDLQDQLSVAQKLYAAEIRSVHGSVDTVEQGTVIYLDGSFFQATSDIDLTNPGLIEDRMRTMSIMDTVQNLTSDIDLG